MIHLQRFIDRVQSSEARGLRDLNIPISDAKSMAAELTRILLEIQNVREQASQPPVDEVIQMKISGGSFK